MHNIIKEDEYEKLVYKCNINKSKFTYKYFYNYKDSGFIKKFRIYLDSNKKNLFYYDENNNLNYLKKLVVFYE
jgi:hypothetical protein